MAAAATALLPNPYAFRNLPLAQKKILQDMDVAFGEGKKHNRINEEGEIAGLGAGILFYKKDNNGELYLLLGELKKKDARNGMLASFSGGAQVGDFGKCDSPAFATACRELLEELGKDLISISTFCEAVDQETTVVGVNSGFTASPRFVNPIFLVRSTEPIDKALASFQETEEVKRVYWVNARTILESAEAVNRTYLELRDTFIHENWRFLEQQARKELLLKKKEATPQEIKQEVVEIAKKDLRLKAVRDGVVTGRAENGLLVQIAHYTGRSIGELSKTLYAIMGKA